MFSTRVTLRCRPVKASDARRGAPSGSGPGLFRSYRGGHGAYVPVANIFLSSGDTVYRRDRTRPRPPNRTIARTPAEAEAPVFEAASATRYQTRRHLSRKVFPNSFLRLRQRHSAAADRPSPLYPWNPRTLARASGHELNAKRLNAIKGYDASRWRIARDKRKAKHLGHREERFVDCEFSTRSRLKPLAFSRRCHQRSRQALGREHGE